MATNPKMQPCPCCGSAEHLTVYTHSYGWRHVECDNGLCQYMGPGEGSVRAAIKAHNEKVAGVAGAGQVRGIKRVAPESPVNT
jgi:hypothetical protein